MNKRIGVIVLLSAIILANGISAYYLSNQHIIQERFDKGFSISMGFKERLWLPYAGYEKTFAVENVDYGFAIINISETTSDRIEVLDEKKYDVTNDSYYDLYIKLESIRSLKANFTIKRINEFKYSNTPVFNSSIDDEPVYTEPKNNNNPVNSDDKNNTLLDFIVNPFKNGSSENLKNFIIDYKYALIAIVSILLLIILYLIFFRDQKKHKNLLEEMEKSIEFENKFKKSSNEVIIGGKGKTVGV